MFETISHGWMIIEYLIHSNSLFSCSIVLQSTESKLTFHVSRCMGELCYVPISEYHISVNCRIFQIVAANFIFLPNKQIF
jgi:hypothetical protein